MGSGSGKPREAVRVSKLLAWIIVAVILWFVYHRVVQRAPPVARPAVSHRADTLPKPRFHCDGRRYCSQMHSRAEAEFFVRHCPGTRMDGDHDGIPCENDSRF